MAASNLAEMQWVDIIPPDATATPLDFAMVAATLAAIAIVIVAIYFYLSRPKQQARRKILALAGRDNLNNDQRRDGSHLIAKELGKAFGVKRLSTVRFGDAQQKRWETFLQTLDTNRFAPQTPSPDNFSQLATEAISWLRLRS